MSGPNRNAKMNRKAKRLAQGERLLAEDRRNKESDNDWNLSWFTPKGLQLDCVESIQNNIFTIIDGPSGSGKTTVALWMALQALKSRHYDKLIFLKNPTEVGDDQLGFLSGNEEDKLVAHMSTTKEIFDNFISRNKLDNDIRRQKIRLTIPNFLLGATFDNVFCIIDEAQLMSPDTIKLLTERCGKGSKYVILGDSKQRYAVKKRNDGFNDFIKRCTIEHLGNRYSKYEPMVGYVRMSRHDNQRGEGSKFINKLYEEE